MRKLFSILIPSRNAVRWIGEAVSSCLRGGCGSAEVIVVDGGSDDGTVEVLKQFHAKLAYWVSEPDRGQSHALNKALAHAHGEIIGWLNADDYYLPGAFEAATRAFDEHPDAVTVYGDYVRVDAEGHPYARRRQPTFDYWDCLFSYLTVQNTAAFFKRSALESVGGWDENLHYALDYDLVLKQAKLGPVVHVRRYLGAFRLHPRSKTATKGQLFLQEARQVRIRHLGCGLGRWGWWWRHKYHKARVLARMLREGCLGSRLGWDRKDR